MTVNKVGFNNFKSFGERTQTFSKKPITLIYGANSVGKSSVLHFLLLMEHIKKTKSLDLNKSYFAGDGLDLGGFANFIHKKDINKKISYQLTFNKEKEINQSFSPVYGICKHFEREGVFDKIISKKVILRRILNYKLKESEPPFLFKRGKTSFSYVKKTKTKKEFENFKWKMVLRFIEINNENILFKNIYNKQKKKRFDQLLKEKEKADNPDSNAFMDAIHKEVEDDLSGMSSNNKDYLELFNQCVNTKESKELVEVLERKDGKTFDEIDRLIIYIMEEMNLFEDITFKPDADFSKKRKFLFIYRIYYVNVIYNNIKRLKFISTITTIKADISLGYPDKKINRKNQMVDLDYYINGELLFKHNSTKDKIVRNEQSYFINTMKSFESAKFDLTISDTAIKPLFLPFDLGSDMVDIIDASTPFKLGAYNLFVGSIYNNFSRSITKSDSNKHGQYLGPMRFVPERIDLQLSSILKDNNTSPFDNKLNVNIGRYFGNMKLPKYFILLNMSFLKSMFKVLYNMIIIDFLNEFKKEKNKQSISDAKNTEKIWQNFLNSTEIQKTIGDWLSNDNKINSTYSLQVETHTTPSFFRKLFRLKLKQYKQLRFIDKRSNTPVTPKEMGLGISQVLPVLVTLHTLKNYNIFIEQPELHLHPAVQCEVADDIIKSKNINNNDLYIESHSEHMLLRFMRRMRETSEGIIKPGDPLALTPDDVCLLYVDYNGSFTYLNELDLDKDGTLLDPWPNGFFEEGYKERFS